MIQKIKIAVLVSGGGTNLQALIDYEAAGKLKHGEISLVLSNKPEAFALKRAENAHIPTAVVNRKDFKNREDFENEMIRVLEQNGIELIILAGFMCILGEKFCKRFADRIINVHPSLIPSFCGAGYYGLHVHEAALAYGVKVTGATVHFVNEIPDGGKIIMQKAVKIRDDDTPESLQKRVMAEAEWIILPASAEKVCTQLIKCRTK